MSKSKEAICKQIYKCHDIIRKHRIATIKLRDMIKKEYGVDYNDVDCDPVIDCANYGKGEMSVQILDEGMYIYANVPVDRDEAAQTLGDE